MSVSHYLFDAAFCSSHLGSDERPAQAERTGRPSPHLDRSADSLRKIVKIRGHLPSDEAATKLLLLALRNIEKDWKLPQRTWKLAANQFAIMFGERFTNTIN